MLEQIDVAIGFSVVMLLLSMLVTVFVQAVTAAFDLRGRNLVWGLTKLFHQIGPDFQGPARRDWNEVRSSVGKKLAEAVAKHPLLKHSLAGRAKAIRADELMTVLGDLAANPARRLEGEPARVLKDWVEKAAPSSEVASVARTLLAKIESTRPDQAPELRKLVEEALGAAGRLQQGVEQWFDGAMGRSSDVFQRWTKAITIAGAFALAFGLQADSLDIYRQVSTNAGVRARLGAIADETARKAADVLDLDAKRIEAAWARVQARHPSQKEGPTLPAAPAGRRCGDTEEWIAQTLDAALAVEFRGECQKEALGQLGSVGTSLSSIKTSLDVSGLSLPSYGDAGEKGRWRRWRSGFKDSQSGAFRLRHLLGVLATAVLLSLGAPFWYNVLRQFCSLKPASARQIDHELKQTTPVPRPAK